MTGARMTDELRVDDDDWFGEGSSFDSGEELAAALAALGSAQPLASEADGGSGGGVPEAVRQGPIGAPASPNPLLGRAGHGAHPASPGGHGELSGRRGQIPGRSGQGEDAANWPTIGAQTPPPRARQPGAQKSGEPGWRIRQGVRSLRQAEEALERLRGDAIVVAWAAAAAALRRSGRRG